MERGDEVLLGFNETIPVVAPSDGSSLEFFTDNCYLDQ